MICLFIASDNYWFSNKSVSSDGALKYDKLFRLLYRKISNLLRSNKQCHVVSTAPQ